MPEEQVIKNVESAPKPEITPPAESEANFGSAIERAPEQKLAAKAETSKAEPQPATIPTTSTFKTPQQIREEQIDQILSEGLEQVFLSLPLKQQKQFQVEGEVTVKKINLLLSSAQVKIKALIDLIKAWLKIIPGVNKFFLEQEAKIKADKIIKLKG